MIELHDRFGDRNRGCVHRGRHGITNDAGTAATAFPGAYKYYNLFINGMLQTADTSSVTTTAITIPGGDALDGGTPLVVQFVVS
ncbi:hypothetical protein ABIE48_002534 [Paenibacillus sp. OAE614]